MDPITLSILGTTVAVSVVTATIGFVAGRRVGRNQGDAGELRSEVERLELDLEQAKRNRDFHERKSERQSRALGEVMEARDKYRAMAESHEIRLPEMPEVEEYTETVWEGRRFCNHPEKNLENMAKELEQYKGHEVLMWVSIKGSGQFGAWASHLKNKWSRTRNGRTIRIADLGPWEYHGTAERALEDFKVQVLDDDTGLVIKRRDTGQKDWRDTDSPLLFEVTLKVIKKREPKPPEVQIVEVPVVEVQREIEVVERPVFISVPEGQEENLCGHTQEEIRKMVKDELNRHDAEQEVESLGRMVGLNVEEEKERLRKARAARASRQKQ